MKCVKGTAVSLRKMVFRFHAMKAYASSGCRNVSPVLLNFGGRCVN